jgi:hypothetical protein
MGLGLGLGLRLKLGLGFKGLILGLVRVGVMLMVRG